MQHAFGTLQECSAVLLFNPQIKYFKRPFGAVSTEEKVEIVFPIREDFWVEKVNLIIRGNDGAQVVALPFLRKNNDYNEFGASFCLKKADTYYYRFELYQGDRTCYVGASTSGQAIIGEWLPEWQLTVYDAGYSTPDHIKGGVVYQIFVDRFASVDQKVLPRYGVTKKWTEDVTIVDSDGVYRANDFYGGNFKGIISKLDYLEDLGVTTLYLSPIFESNSNHRYDTADYTKIEPMLGTEEEFVELIDEGKKRGISIMLDGVFNHTGADSIYFNKFGHYDEVGAYQSQDSKYHNWYSFSYFPDEYTCWWGITCVPTIRRNSQEFHRFIAGKGGVIEKWTKLGVKGWRLDVVDELDSVFVKQIRRCIKSTDPSCVMIGEVWEDASKKYSYGEEREYFRGKELDGVMNYPFMDSIIGYVKSGNSAEFFIDVMAIYENYPKQAMDTCLSLIDSHDTVRAINNLSDTQYCYNTKEEKLKYRLTEEEYALGKKRLLIASALQYFLPGVPSLYYGDEIGMEGFEDPLNRRPYDNDHIDEEILSHYRMLGRVRKEYREEFFGEMKITFLNSALKITRNKISLIVNTGEKTELDKTYTVLTDGKKANIIEKYQLIITLD